MLNAKKVRSWNYYEITLNGKVLMQTLSDTEAHYFVKGFLDRTDKEPEIHEHYRTENDSPK